LIGQKHRLNAAKMTLSRVPVAAYLPSLLCFWLVGWLTTTCLAAEKRQIVASTTQVADFARQIVGERWEVHSILAPGQDPHLYDIKPGDAELVAQADLCLENGWHLEGKDWMRRLAEAAGKPLVTCAEGVEPLELDEQGEAVRDPHAWFTPQNAATYVRNITAAVARLDPDHKAEYEARARLYLDQLRVLHHWILEQLSAVPAEQRVLVTSHDAFNYFCRAYGFTAKTPAGWSTGDEVGGGVTEERREQTIAAIRASGVRAIFVETSVNDKMIRTIADQAGVKIGGRLYSDSMGEPGSAGETYLGMMRENVLTIVEALK
jgi:manganese/iron transport system substrate-binding protein